MSGQGVKSDAQVAVEVIEENRALRAALYELHRAVTDEALEQLRQALADVQCDARDTLDRIYRHLMTGDIDAARDIARDALAGKRA